MKEEYLISSAKIEKIAAYLDEHISYFLETWLRNSKITKDDPFYEEVKKNGIMTVKLIKDSLNGSYPDVIESLMKKVANERVKANVNISEFIYNINVGRKIVIEKVLSESLLSYDEKLFAILVTNQLFDDYAYLSVREYTKLKDEIIKEKSLFIQEMHQDRLSLLGQLSAGFAHEFRNPLTAIKGFVQLLEQNSKNESNEKYFEIITRELNNLERKTNQFLYFSKVEGIIEEKKCFHLQSAIEEMLDLLYPRIVEEDIIVTKRCEGDLYICGVEEQIKQVILNVLNNAADELRNGKQEEKRIDIVAIANNNNVTLSISNNGPKIPKYIIDNVFAPFVSTKKLGTGLGLSVCKNIIDMHKGNIAVQSTDEQTTFSITFPKYELCSNEQKA